MQNKKLNNFKEGFAVIPVIVIVIVVLGLGSYYLLFHQNLISTKKQPRSTSTVGAVDETANWKTYRNEQYGFEVKYPSNWKYNESENTNTNQFLVCFDPLVNTSCSGGGEMISVSWKTTLDDQYKTIQPRHANLYDYQKTEVVISGENAQQFTSDNPEAVSKAAFLNHGGYVYSFILNWNNVVAPHKDTLNQILSTFRFTK